MAERVALHHHIPPPWEKIPICVDPFLVDYLVPTEDAIKWAVRLLTDNRSRGPASSPHPLSLLVLVEYGGLHGRELQGGIKKLSGVDSGVPVVLNNFQQVCGYSGAQLGLTGGRIYRRSR